MKIHILAIAGSMTTSLAIALKKQGHLVSGTDQEKIFPPFSTQLLGADIPINSTKIDSTIDLCIIGSAYSKFSRCVNEFETIKSLNIPYISATEYLSQNLVKSESIVVAGSFGKTTITTLLSFLFTKLKLNPNYFFGGQSVDNLPSLNFSDSNWSVVEGDESINGLDTQAKFFSYHPKYLILTSAQWEHKESYLTFQDNFNAFKKLVELLPQDGILVYNPHDTEISNILPYCQATKTPYQSFDFDTNLIGHHNHENICATLTLIKALNLNIDQSLNFIKEFHGVSRRLEIKNKNKNIIIDDFAQSANRILQSLNAVKSSYPQKSLKVYFEPHASFLQNKSAIKDYATTFDGAEEVVLSQIKFNSNISKADRVTASTYREVIGKKLVYLPSNDEIFNHYINTLKPSDILIHFSSGGLDGLNNLDRIIAILNTSL
ncbi:hypothetical protein KBC75_03510 [Candidatus Shapirobacteria bacterium]|nr:hypothetical protein [Candidatus Shapirobacteria bacterium]